MRFAAPVAEFIRERRWHPSERVEVLDDGSLRWRATVSGEQEFVGWVLSWSPWAELEGTAPWREALAARARAMAHAHASVRPLREDLARDEGARVTATRCWHASAC